MLGFTDCCVLKKESSSKSIGQDDIKTTLDFIRELREGHDLTQRAIGSVLEISQQQYSQHETGAVKLRLRHFIKLAEYYHFSANCLIGQ